MTPKPLGADALVAPRWGDLPERGTPASLRLIAWIAVHIGRWTTRLLLYPVTLYFVISAAEARRVSYEYLRRVRERPAHWWHVFRHFYCFAATILDRLYLLRSEFEHFEVTLHEKEILLRKMLEIDFVALPAAIETEKEDDRAMHNSGKQDRTRRKSSRRT